MFALLAAATLAAAQPADPSPRTFVRLEPPGAKSYGRHSTLCPAAGRMHTNYAEPALLFREQDRAAAQLKKLIEMPDGRFCLLGGTRGGETERRTTR
jgi:hypothetical protein